MLMVLWIPACVESGAASGVSTHTVYTRFGDKAGLFDALVKEAADGLMKLYLDAVDALDGCSNFPGVGTCGGAKVRIRCWSMFISILRHSS